MDKTTKKAAVRAQKHREDGEEAIKQTSKVIPIDAGQGNESPEGNTNTRRPAADTKSQPSGFGSG
ncbi:MAG TPA: hypothetical protein VHW45_15765 [Candidatus Sulfotelmatobacter sp.]|jgi:hypothetical protein|nr:hypothetical protein [Candidatus Sulfotelmatobacter sp.]